MFLPVEYVWFEPVLIAAIVVFVVSWIGNSLIFSNRLANALATAIVFALIFGTIVYFGYGNISMSVTTEPSPTAPGQLKKPNQ